MEYNGDGSKGIIDPLSPDFVDLDGSYDIQPESDTDFSQISKFYSEQKRRPTIYNGTGQKTLNIDVNAEQRALLPDDQKDSLPVDMQDVTRPWFDRYTDNEGLNKAEPEQQYTYWEKLNAFAETENSAYSKYVETDYDQSFDRNYDPLDSPEALQNPDLAYRLINANNQSEAQAIIKNFRRETKNRAIIDQTSFWGSFGYSALVMSLDPVMLPAMLFTGGAAFTAVAGARGVALATAGVAGTNELIAEIIKHDSQQLRTPEETFVNVASATILGGLLGGLGAKVSLRDMDKAKKAADQFAYEFVGPPSREGMELIQKVKVGDAETVAKAAADGTLRDSVGAARRDDVFLWQQAIADPEAISENRHKA